MLLEDCSWWSTYEVFCSCYQCSRLLKTFCWFLDWTDWLLNCMGGGACMCPGRAFGRGNTVCGLRTSPLGRGDATLEYLPRVTECPPSPLPCSPIIDSHFVRKNRGHQDRAEYCRPPCKHSLSSVTVQHQTSSSSISLSRFHT